MGRRSRYRRGRIRLRLRLPPAVWVALLLVGLIASRLYQLPTTTDPAIFESGGLHLVERVVDGDTLLLAGGSRVRLIGVDTPETKHPTRPIEPWGVEASQFTQKHVEGKYVRLEFDRERRDRYQRILAYVYVDDWFLNEELILAGYSRAETKFRYSETMKRHFRKVEQQARESSIGIWAEK